MTTTGRSLFVNVPVADVARSEAFFTALGFEFNPAFSDGSAVCMIVGEGASFMLLQRDTFAGFSPLPVGDPTEEALALFCFSVDSRADVDRVAEAAVAAGGVQAEEQEDHGFMYARSFFDPDHHGWQVMWMDPAAAAAGPPAAETTGA